MEIEEVIDDASFFRLEPTWSSLFEASENATPFQSWEWLSSWRRHHPEGQLWVLIARDHGVAVGLLPLVLTRYRTPPFRQVRFMGAPLSDFQELLGPAARAAESSAAFGAHLRAHRERWDVCDLNDLREGSALTCLSAITTLRGELGFHRQCPVIKLAPSWELFARTLGKNLRTNIGRRRRQLEKNCGAALDTVNGESLPEALEALFRLHNQRWQKRGAAGAFSSPRVQAFHREVARAFLGRGWLKLHRLVAQGETRAAFYCFAHRERVYYYLSGFDLALGKYSPGNVLMAYAIEQAIASGAERFELLRGDETYKYEWKAEDERTQRLVLGHGSLRSHLATSGHRLERFIEHTGLKVQRQLWGRKRARPAAEK